MEHERKELLKMCEGKKYSVIYADPCWKTWSFKQRKDGQLRRDLPYGTMTDEQIKSFPVKEIIADDAILFLWAIDNKIPMLNDFMTAWGFQFKCVGFVWVKKAKTTNGVNAGFSKYTRRACEFCYIGTRGKYIVKKKSLDQFIFEPKREHSRKPDTIRQIITEMMGDVPRLEMFAREKHEGWDAWGNETDKFETKGGEIFNNSFPAQSLFGDEK
jgi:site-specific DNA-methyltransferase (adenine-specific)